MTLQKRVTPDLRSCIKIHVKGLQPEQLYEYQKNEEWLKGAIKGSSDENLHLQESINLLYRKET